MRSLFIRKLTAFFLVCILYLYSYNQIYAQSAPKFYLVDAQNDVILFEIQDQLQLNTESIDLQEFSIIVDDLPENTNRVVYTLQGPINHYQSERRAPHALFGDDLKGDFYGRRVIFGDYTLNYKITHGNAQSLEGSISFNFNTGTEELRFALIDANTDLPVAEIQDGDVFDLSELGLEEYSIEVISYPSATTKIGFVQKAPEIDLIEKNEGFAPYALFGDNSRGDYYGKPANPGLYEFEISTFVGYNKGVSASISFEFINPVTQFGVFLADADNDKVIAPLENNQVFDLNDFGTSTFSVLTTRYPFGTRSIRYTLNSPISIQRVENTAPLTLYGDKNGDYFGQEPLPGVYELKIEAFDQKYGVGTASGRYYY